MSFLRQSDYKTFNNWKKFFNFTIIFWMFRRVHLLIDDSQEVIMIDYACLFFSGVIDTDLKSKKLFEVKYNFQFLFLVGEFLICMKI